MSALRSRGKELEKGERFFIQLWWGEGEGGKQSPRGDRQDSMLCKHI